MRKTAWSKSTVPSDRIPPPRNSTPSKSKGKAKDNGSPKSKEVLKLERLLEGLKSGTAGRRDLKGACFCQARGHPLSPYTPLCTTCGFILCDLHEPAYTCPHCSTSLTNPSSREALVQRITQEISDTLRREEEERQRLRLEKEKAVGAFPTLALATGNLEPPKPAQPRKVLSLNQQTRKVTVSSYNPVTTPAPNTVAQQEEVFYRVPRPPRDVEFVSQKKLEGARRWENLRDGTIAYVPLVLPKNQGTVGRQRKKKQKPGPSIPGAPTP
ncbi:hypothetical protein M422DRAFT_200185 [Sphaerobolus stellatus SS14]|nr:hypothetical protein M422DRAFT_200185 [Sphaerobolus stellatus SS14]